MSHNQDVEAKQEHRAGKLIVELEAMSHQPITFELSEPSLEGLAREVHDRTKDENLFLFEKDEDGELSSIGGRSSILLVAHSCKQILVSVNFEHQTKTEKFSPSASVFRVLNWAIGKHGYTLDDTAKSKANLILPGTDSPLRRDESIGKYATQHTCSLTLELTLRDFTNGDN